MNFFGFFKHVAFFNNFSKALYNKVVVVLCTFNEHDERDDDDDDDVYERKKQHRLLQF